MDVKLKNLVYSLSPNYLTLNRQMIPTGWHIVSIDPKSPYGCARINEIMYQSGVGRWTYLDVIGGGGGGELLVGFELYEDSVMVKLSV